MTFKDIKEGDYCYDLHGIKYDLVAVIKIEDGRIELDNGRSLDEKTWDRVLWKIDLTREMLEMIGFKPSDNSVDPKEFRKNELGCLFVLKRVDPKIEIIKDGEFSGCRSLTDSKNGISITSWDLSCKCAWDMDGEENYEGIIFLNTLNRHIRGYIERKYFNRCISSDS